MRESQNSGDIVPIFGEPLTYFTHQGGTNTIKELASRPDVLVRSGNIYTDLKQIKREVKEQKLFRLLQERYGIALPNFQSIVAADEYGRKRIFTIVDKIFGMTLDDAETLPIEAIPKIDTFFKNFLQSLLDAYSARQPFYCDFGLRQCMYGHKHNESAVQDDIYLVDVGEGFFYPEEKDYYDSIFHQLLVDLEEDIAACERKFPEGTVLKIAREKLKEARDKFGI